MKSAKGAAWQIGDSIETFDDVHLPQRSTAIERTCVQARNLVHQLAPVAWLGQRQVAHVELEIDLRILDPVGPVESQRNHRQAPPEDGRDMQSRAEMPKDVLERDLALGRRRWVVDAERRYVIERVPLLGVEDETVGSGELFHVILACPARDPVPVLYRGSRCF